MNDPIQLTPRERAWDAVVSLDNWRRYQQQSRATRDGQPAPFPARETLAGVAAVFKQMFGG